MLAAWGLLRGRRDDRLSAMYIADKDLEGGGVGMLCGGGRLYSKYVFTLVSYSLSAMGMRAGRLDVR